MTIRGAVSLITDVVVGVVVMLLVTIPGNLSVIYVMKWFDVFRLCQLPDPTFQQALGLALTFAVLAPSPWGRK